MSMGKWAGSAQANRSIRQGAAKSTKDVSPEITKAKRVLGLATQASSVWPESRLEESMGALHEAIDDLKRSSSPEAKDLVGDLTAALKKVDDLLDAK